MQIFSLGKIYSFISSLITVCGRKAAVCLKDNREHCTSVRKTQAVQSQVTCAVLIAPAGQREKKHTKIKG